MSSNSEPGAHRIEAPLPAAGAESAESVSESQPPGPEPGNEGPDARRAVRLSLWSSLVLQAINTLSGVELARGLGLEGRGQLAAAMLWPTVIGAIATLGLEESVTYHVARAGRAGVDRILGSALGLCAIQGLAFTGVTAVVVPLALHSKGSYVVGCALLYTLYVPLNMLGVTLNGSLNGLHLYRRYNIVRLAIGILVIGIQTALLIADRFTVFSVVLGLVFANVATELTAAYLVRKSRLRPTRPHRRTMRSIFGYGIRSHASSTSSYLNQRLDQLVISIFLTASQLGLYVVAVTFTSLTTLIGGSVAAATLPNVASMSDGDGEGRALLARRLVSLTLIASFAVTLPIFVLAPELVRLFFGSQFDGAAALTRILAPAVVVLSTNRALEAVLRGIGKPLDAGISEFVALGTTVIALAAFLPLLGIQGAAWASVAAYLTAGGWMVTRASRGLGVSPLTLLVLDRQGAQLVVARVRLLAGRATHKVRGS